MIAAHDNSVRSEAGTKALERRIFRHFSQRQLTSQGLAQRLTTHFTTLAPFCTNVARATCGRRHVSPRQDVETTQSARDTICHMFERALVTQMADGALAPYHTMSTEEIGVAGDG